MTDYVPGEEQFGSPAGSGNSQNQRTQSLRFFLDIIEILLLAGILYFGINAISVRIRVEGVSMLPTLHTGEFVIVNRLSYKLGELSHGDVIVFRFPRDPHQEFIKRVIGLPGDKISVSRGVVSVNDRVMDESYIAAPPGYEGEWIVPQRAVFVLGDNRNNSSDSHDWGPVPLEDIIGKAVFVYWPPNEWGLVEGSSIARAGN